MNESQETNLWWRRTFAGAWAGVISRTTTAPLERVKILRQVNSEYLHTGLWRTLSDIRQREGTIGFWKGNGINTLRIAPYNSIQFATFGMFKKTLRAEDSTIKLIMAGAMSGMTSVACCYPLDLARATLAIQKNEKKYCGLVDTINKVYSQSGVRGVYRGLCVSMFGIAPYVATNFTTFEILKKKTHKYKDYPNIKNLLLGGVAGTTATVITYPTDLVRRKIQLGGILGAPKYTNTADCIRHIHTNHGIRGFYTGMLPSFLKIIPTMAISFMVYEQVMKILGELDGKDDQNIRGGL